MLPRLKSILALSAMSAIGLILPMTAQAQFSRNSDAPLQADADDASNTAGVTTLSGQVDIRQGETRILADLVKIYGGSTGVGPDTGDVNRMEAIGNFYYLTPNQEVRGNNGIYTKETDTFTVTGDVILLQGENVVTGNTLIYNLTTEEARVVGTCKGRRCGSKGRVKILIKNTGNQSSS